jgi:signal transduction histidine kinase
MSVHQATLVPTSWGGWFPGPDAEPEHDGRAGATTVPGRMVALWRWTVAHPRLIDSGLAGALFVIALPGLSGRHHDASSPGIVALALLIVASAALVFRRSHPVLVCAVAVGAGAVAVLHGVDGPPSALPTFLALYTVGSRAPVRTTLLATAATAAAYTVSRVVLDGTWVDAHGDVPALTNVALAGAAAAVGVAVRSQRVALEAAKARAHQAELTREEEAVRRVTDERLRIAQELHDIVAHHISVISVQAGVARHLLDTDPGQARTALGLVRDASRTVLSEMSAVVGLLRTQDEEMPTEPAPGLAGIGSLVDSIRHAGLDLDVAITGDPYELPPVNDLTAYRVVQESLTNAVKHGDGTADLVIDYGAEAVRIGVRNPVRETGTAARGSGHGLIGMRERVEAVQGRLTAGPGPQGAFRVHAQIPRSSA